MACRSIFLRLDLFCQVIDNFGDAGVCWRLARQLAGEYGFRVRLWIDRLAVLQKICPEVIAGRPEQTVCGVDIRLWPSSFPDLPAGDIPDGVIEGFGVHLPECYVRQMATRQIAPVWINLEYLSAESWVEDSHLMASPQSWVPLTKYFYFPGFTRKTGGLIREKGILDERDNFQCDREHAIRFLSSLGVAVRRQQFIVSLFCYPGAPVESLLESFKNGDRDILCLVPEGVAVEAVRSFMKRPAVAGTRFSSGRLDLQILPMIEQSLYDRLLWSCDLNFVRGEDSFVRAQWAGRPFVWHIYPQEDDIHLPKLEAFLKRYLAGVSEEDARKVKRFWHVWNRVHDGRISHESWEEFRELMPLLSRHGYGWSKKMAALPDLASGLVRFINTYALK